ncbi:MAG: hypothetical protein KGJ44_08160 [Betaproteobacteria bacterium]|nr:hypothetical protein [Betaproteobacteria bacterium]
MCRAAWLALVALPLAACQHMAVADAPATLAGADTACITQMTGFAAAQTGRKVTLTARAFADSDKLLLEQPLLLGPNGLPLDGRSRGRPQVFHLVKRGGQCVMVNDATRAEQVLDACTCTAAP